MHFIILLAIAIATALISALASRPPKQEPEPPANLKDFNFPQIDEGTPEAVCFGDAWTSSWMVLWYGNLRSSPIMSDTVGKKG